MQHLTKDDLIRQGSFCFRYRSFLPIMMIPLALLSISTGERWFEAQGGWVEMMWHIAVFSVAALGFLIRFWVIGSVADGTSGRNTTKQIAEELNTTGAYSLCRNPLYLGNFLIWGALALMTESLFFVILYTAIFALFYERVFMCEEQFLHEKFGGVYERWARRTPSFFPNLKSYCTSQTPFSLKRVLRKEYPGIINFALLIFLLETVLEHSEHLKWEFEPYWIASVLSTVMLGLTLRTLRKKTAVLY